MKFSIKRCIDSLGRIVLPKDVRSYFDIKSGDMLEIAITENGIMITKAIKESEMNVEPTV